MLKRILVVLSIVLLTALTLANTPPTDPDGEVVYMPQGSTGPVRFGSNYPEGGVPISELPSGIAAMSSGTADCDLGALQPYKETATQVYGYAGLRCTGDVVATKLTGTLQRHKWGPWWVNLQKKTLGWTSQPGIDINLRAACKSGTYTYRTVADGWVRDGNDDVTYGQSVSDKAKLPC